MYTMLSSSLRNWIFFLNIEPTIYRIGTLLKWYCESATNPISRKRYKWRQTWNVLMRQRHKLNSFKFKNVKKSLLALVVSCRIPNIQDILLQSAIALYINCYVIIFFVYLSDLHFIKVILLQLLIKRVESFLKTILDTF